MTKFLSIDEVYALHEKILTVSEGRSGVRDFALLHSAIERPQSSFNGEDLYPTLFAKAAALLHSLCMNHAFFDGNKRTAYGSTAGFLYMNGYTLKASVKEAADFMVHVDNDKPDFKEIVDWIKKHATKKP